MKENFENKKNVEEYEDAYKEWEAAMEELKNLYNERRVDEIIKNLNMYRFADVRFKKIADKYNAPLPDKWIADMADELLKSIAGEESEFSKLEDEDE
jgi:hypothetical protein